MILPFVETNPQAIEDEIIQRYEAAAGQTLYPGDERRLFAQQVVAVAVGLRNDINDTGNQNLLRSARGVTLEALGELFDITRLPAQKARYMVRFTLAEGAPAPVTVPAGTRVSPDGVLYFATDAALEITGAYGDTAVTATVGGIEHNGFIAGQINRIIDPVPYVMSAANTAAITEGTEIESDDSLRERIHQAPESYSVAGPEGAYVFWAKSADRTIADVAIDAPEESPGTVHVAPLLAGGIIPGQDILDAVDAVLSSRTRRPLTDRVFVDAPEAVSYDITASYWISTERETDAVAIQAAMEGTGGAVDAYIAWQRAKLGRAVNPNQLVYLMLQAGASRVTVSAPVYEAITKMQVAQEGVVTVSYGGLE